MSEEQKQEQKQEVKQDEKIEVIEPKCCPFSISFLLEPVRTLMKQTTLAKTTNVAPCMENRCKFYNEDKKECYILLKLKA